MVKKVMPIDYTSRDFDSIRQDLVSYVKRYYPNTYKDFNEASFGALMLDVVSLIGDNLSFYLDYNSNESFMQTSLEYENVLMHAKQLGYKYVPARSSVGEVDIYIPVPADSVTVKPDIKYLPKLLKGTTFSTPGGKVFTLNENVDFYSENIEVVGDQVSSEQADRIEWYILKVTARVVSGEESEAVVEIGDFQRFLKVEVPSLTVGEIVRVVDYDNNEYYEVDYLTQNVVTRLIQSSEEKPNEQVNSILKKYPVARRFVVERDGNRTFLVFGYGSEKDLKTNKIADPSEVAMKISGKNYVSDATFDPTMMVSSDKFGVSPVNTTLTIRYRYNTHDNANTAVGTITDVRDALIEFRNRQNLEDSKVQYITNNIQVYNELPVNGDITVPTTEEIKQRSAAYFATQGRAVTKQDYISAAYAMPSQLGSVKRCTISRDKDDFRRNLNLHMISEGSDGDLERASDALKKNLRTWLNSVRMVSDSIDIYDAVLVNLAIEFDVIAQDNVNKNQVFSRARQAIFEKLTETMPELGEPFYISEVFKILKDVEEVLDVINVKVVSIDPTGNTNYRSDILYDIENNISPEGRAIYFPHNYIWEIKYVGDVRGTVR